MKEHQAREIIFEQKVMELLESTGYIAIKRNEVSGRSGRHGVGAYGVFNFPTAFMYPARLIGQYKFYAKNKVELSHIRDFTGIMKDIAESNYNTTGGSKNTPNRYTDIGCYFSATGFTRAAQEYAWAHNIFMMSYERIAVLQPMLEHIQEFVSGLSENTINNITGDELLDGYSLYCKKQNQEPVCVEAVIGIANGVYPVMIFGTEGWFKEVITKELSVYGGELVADSASREENMFETAVELNFKGVRAQLSLPNVVLEKLAARSDNPTGGECMLKLEIPFADDRGRKSFIGTDVIIAGYDRLEYGYEQMSLI